ncbi:MAG: putative ATP-dependent RNA helicase ddx27, partial [Paramarteilia canceri]
KTLAYIIPIIQRLLFKPQNTSAACRVLILLPTRELAAQVHQVCQLFCKNSPTISSCLVVGGTSINDQLKKISTIPDIIVGTPGRFLDLVKMYAQKSKEDDKKKNLLSNIEILVLDEADRLIDENFTEQLTELLSQCPSRRQTLLYSATINESIGELLKSCKSDFINISMSSSNEVTDKLTQKFIKIKSTSLDERENALLYTLLNEKWSTCIIFSATKHTARKLFILLQTLDFLAYELHGNMSQQY